MRSGSDYAQAPQAAARGASEAVHAHLASQLGSAFRPVDPGPAPPDVLSLQTSGLRPGDRIASAEEYWAGAYLGALIYLQLYDRAGGNLRTCGSFLDFGCGTGKLSAIYRSIDGIALPVPTSTSA